MKPKTRKTGKQRKKKTGLLKMSRLLSHLSPKSRSTIFAKTCILMRPWSSRRSSRSKKGSKKMIMMIGLLLKKKARVSMFIRKRDMRIARSMRTARNMKMQMMVDLMDRVTSSKAIKISSTIIIGNSRIMMPSIRRRSMIVSIRRRSMIMTRSLMIIKSIGLITIVAIGPIIMEIGRSMMAKGIMIFPHSKGFLIISRGIMLSQTRILRLNILLRITLLC